MQLLDIQTTKSSIGTTEHLQDTLQDIVTNVQIQPNFRIVHPNYQPFQLSTEVVNRFRDMPVEVQTRYLSLQLSTFIYGMYYNGSMRSTLALNAGSQALPLDLENNTFLGVDSAFYDRLHQSNSSVGYFDPDWQVIKQESDGSLLVTKGGLKLHIKRDSHLQPSQQDAIIGDSVAVRMPKNLGQSGFYLAVGNTKPSLSKHSDQDSVLVRIYFNITAKGAVAVMGNLTQLLNESAIPFYFKVLYNPGDYGRYDSGVLYFEKKDYEVVRLAIQTIYMENLAHFLPEIPLFTKFLAPGLGIAEEPNCKFATQESFGMNRCQIVANGLLKACANPNNSPSKRLNAIIQEFSSLKIDWQRAYLNAYSEDIYTPLISA